MHLVVGELLRNADYWALCGQLPVGFETGYTFLTYYTGIYCPQ